MAHKLTLADIEILASDYNAGRPADADGYGFEAEYGYAIVGGVITCLVDDVPQWSLKVCVDAHLNSEPGGVEMDGGCTEIIHDDGAVYFAGRDRSYSPDLGELDDAVQADLDEQWQECFDKLQKRADAKLGSLVPDSEDA